MKNEIEQMIDTRITRIYMEERCAFLEEALKIGKKRIEELRCAEDRLRRSIGMTGNGKDGNDGKEKA